MDMHYETQEQIHLKKCIHFQQQTNLFCLILSEHTASALVICRELKEAFKYFNY